jgi:peptidoglycan/xylan/chitin deacetylase (PgdA/CDA1 family)
MFRNYIWDIPNTQNKIYLTFDDGPTPKVTTWVLDQLKRNGVKATFFCIGKNIDNEPSLFSQIIKEGHSIGNHTFNHQNGWKTETEKYLENCLKCEDSILNLNYKSKIFRPPYGKIKPAQSKRLRQLGYKIIMWDVLSGDYDKKITPEKCLNNVLLNVESGSIIVFHDSIKAFQNLEYVLPKCLAILKQRGFIFDIID